MLRGITDAFLARRVHVNSPLSFFDVVRWLQNERRRRVATRELSRLNDYYLDDIGISRNDIDATVDKSLRESQNRA